MLLSRRVLGGSLASSLVSLPSLNQLSWPSSFSSSVVPARTIKSERDLAVFLVADNDTAAILGADDVPTFQHFSSSLTQMSINMRMENNDPKLTSYRLSETTSPVSLPLHTGYSFGGRGAELSDLLSTGAPDWKLYTFDDRTGIVFEVLATHIAEQQQQKRGASVWEAWHGRRLGGMPTSKVSLVPQWICADGAGASPNGFKCEWSALQNGKIIVGSHGYEVWHAPPYVPGKGMKNVQYVKEIDPLTGTLRHLDWSNYYNEIKTLAGVTPNTGGYLTHEAAAWSDIQQRWFFAPRRFSKDQPWDPDEDATRGCQILISAKDPTDWTSGDPADLDIKITKINGVTEPERGYSAIRFVPDSNDQHIIATKTVETLDNAGDSSYITIFDVDGRVLLPETLISSNQKLEGLEIIGDA